VFIFFYQAKSLILEPNDVKEVGLKGRFSSHTSSYFESNTSVCFQIPSNLGPNYGEVRCRFQGQKLFFMFQPDIVNAVFSRNGQLNGPYGNVVVLVETKAIVFLTAYPMVRDTIKNPDL